MLETQDYLPLLDAQRMRINTKPLPLTDRRVLRGRTTRLAILEAFQMLHSEPSGDLVQATTLCEQRRHRVTVQVIADTLHLHPTTVYSHLRRLRAQGIIE